MSDLNLRFQNLYERLKNNMFFGKKGLGNEVPYYIFDYDPKYELKIRNYINFLIHNLNYEGSTINALEINLYDILIEVLENRNLLHKVEQLENRSSKERFFKAIKSSVNPERILEIIQNKVEKHNVILLTGIGTAWPFMRSHNILNNLQNYISNIPVIMFFPGSYDGGELKLFNIFKDDNYYRAFKID